MASNWRTWVDDRFGVSPIRQTVLDRRVSRGAWYYTDGSTLMFLLAVQFITGACLMLSYAPTPDAAYHSVQYITQQQTLGGFLRGLHYWAAGLMVVLLVAHMFRQIVLGGYKAPREGTWLTGVLLFFGVITMSYTGYLLRWDERAIYGIRVGLHMLYRVPLIGERLVLLVQGGPEIGGRTLTRLYAVHVMFVPLFLLLVAGYHVYLVMLHGVTSMAERRRPVKTADEQRELYDQEKHSAERGETFHPGTTLRSLIAAAVAVTVLLLLAGFVGPRELQPEADLVSPAFPAEEWWFWWYSALLALVPPALQPTVVVGFPLLLFVLLVSLPFIDRGPARGLRRRPIAAIAVALAVIALFSLSAMRCNSAWTGWPDPELPPLPDGVVLTERVEQGRRLYAAYGCTSCHAIAGQGRQVGTDLARLADRYSPTELSRYILNPPAGVPMPSYEGRITEEDLARIVEFVLVAQTLHRVDTGG